MSKPKDLIGKIPIMAIQYYFLIAIMIFTPYLNWKYANENGFIKWLFLGEVYATYRAVIWPYYLYDRYHTADSRDDLNWPEANASESERLKNVLAKMMDRQLTTEDLNEYKSVMIEYSKRVGRKLVAKDVFIHTNALDLVYNYRNELGKSMLESIDKQTPILTSEYEEAKTILLEAGFMKKEAAELDIEMISKAANRQIMTDPSGISHYPPTREHILEMMDKNKILKDNIDALKNVIYQLASDK